VHWGHFLLEMKKREPFVKRLTRKCLVCGNRIRVAVYPDGHYKGGHFFNRIKLPVKGTGKYKKTGTRRLFGKKVAIVKWTGKEKEIEYWECDTCYDEALHEDWLERTIEKLYGKRCPDYEKGCGCCDAWALYDTVIDANRGLL